MPKAHLNLPAGLIQTVNNLSVSNKLCMCVYMSILTYMYILTHMYILTYVYTYICICIYLHICKTYIYICKFSWDENFLNEGKLKDLFHSNNPRIAQSQWEEKEHRENQYTSAHPGDTTDSENFLVALQPPSSCIFAQFLLFCRWSGRLCHSEIMAQTVTKITASK